MNSPPIESTRRADLVSSSERQRHAAAGRPRAVRIPTWVWILILGLSAIEPLTHACLHFLLPRETVATGLHVPDSVTFIHCMRMFDTRFFSPFATCLAAEGNHYAGYFATPFFWIYGIVGVVGRWLDIHEFLMLGFGNGVFGFLYLLSAYLFLRAIAPKQANLAFLLFTLGGGLGGILYLTTGVLGWRLNPSFDGLFLRFALYELIEGPKFSPALHLVRIYYTLPLALILTSLTWLVRSVRENRAHLMGASLFFVLLGAFVNQRLGPMAWLIAALYLAVQQDLELRKRLLYSVVYALPVGLGLAAGLLLMHASPGYVANATTTVRNSIWLSAFASAVFFHLFAAPLEMREGIGQLARPLRVIACAVVGFLGAFLALYCGYTAYYGDVLYCFDGSAALAISDWALLGVPAGILWVRRGSQHVTPTNDEVGWLTLWVLLFLALGLGAFAHGWYLRIVPQRFMVLLGLPVCVLSARRLQKWHACRARPAHVLTVLFLFCGVCSLAVSSLCFQGPLGHAPGQGPYPPLHYERITEVDASLLEHVSAGDTVLAFPPAGDIASLLPGVRVVFGEGSLNLSDQPCWSLEWDTLKFFAPGAAEDFRKRMVETWCVTHIYCPDTWRVPDEVLAELHKTSWLREVASTPYAALFRVERP